VVRHSWEKLETVWPRVIHAHNDAEGFDNFRFLHSVTEVANDTAGLYAMIQVQPSGSSPVHFLVPLPSVGNGKSSIATVESMMEKKMISVVSRCVALLC
jgi:hypothetical protein